MTEALEDGDGPSGGVSGVGNKTGGERVKEAETRGQAEKGRERWIRGRTRVSPGLSQAIGQILGLTVQRNPGQEPVGERGILFWVWQG
jgi:hypothetical protein